MFKVENLSLYQQYGRTELLFGRLNLRRKFDSQLGRLHFDTRSGGWKFRRAANAHFLVTFIAPVPLFPDFVALKTNLNKLHTFTKTK